MCVVLLVGLPIVLLCTYVKCKCIYLCVYLDMSAVNEVYSDVLLIIVTSPRSGPKWRGPREPLGQWGG